MSVRSWPAQGAGNMDILPDNGLKNSTQSEVGVSTTGGGVPHRETRFRNPNEQRTVKAEKAKALFMSRSGYIGNLTRIRREIEAQMSSRGELVDLEKKLTSYNRSWREFVSTHEKYLNVLDGEYEKQAAYDVYEEQMNRKSEFDIMVNSRKGEVCRVENVARSSCTAPSMRSKVSSSSSKFSSLSKRQEKLAIAQLNIGKIARKHDIAKRMLELQNESELLEAQVSRDEALLSVDFCKQAIRDERGVELIDEVEDRYECEHVENMLPSRSTQEREHVSWRTDSHIGDYVSTYQPGSTVEQTNFVSSNQSTGLRHSLAFEPTSPVRPAHSFSEYTARVMQTPVGHVNATTSPSVSVKQSTSVGPATHTQSSYQFPSSLNTPSSQNPPLSSEYPPISSYQLPPLQAPTPRLWDTTWSPRMNTVNLYPSSQVLGVQPAEKVDTNVEIINALKQVVTTPKLEYMHFDGNPVKFTSFMHNFETCLEKPNNSNEARLQLLIQHCHGKARDAIETCVNLSADEGYRVAKETLKENFGKPHIIAKAHTNKLINLPILKKADGSSLLEFARHLDSTNRTLKGMGPEYVNDLNHVNTLKELNRKLPMFLRARWTEEAGKIYEAGSRPQFEDFLKFIKKRATLVNNEFGDDLTNSGNTDGDRDKSKNRERSRFNKENFTLIAGIQNNERNQQTQRTQQRGCSLCAGQHGLWQCERFKLLSLLERKKVVAEKALCFKCLAVGHYARICPKKTFRCQSNGCGREHHTLLHPERNIEGEKKRSEQAQESKKPETPEYGASQSFGSNVNSREEVAAATGAGESRVCLGVIPVKVRAKNGMSQLETYALLDSGSEVTLCHEQLTKKLDLISDNREINFTLTGMTGSQSLKSKLVDVVVESMDGSTTVELENVRTVESIPISKRCIPKKEDLKNWSHLENIDLHETPDENVMLIIGLKENPQLFIPLEYRVGGGSEPVAVRYSLGWTVMGPVGGKKDNAQCSVNLLQSRKSSERNLESDNGIEYLSLGQDCDYGEEFSDGDCSELKRDVLKHQIESLWKTDFADSVIDTRPCPSIEDKRALNIMESSLKKVSGHFQVALPWITHPPNLPNNRDVAERRCELLKKRLLKDENLAVKYKAAMSEYIEKGHAERVPCEELHPRDKPVWYLPHHPVVHRLKPEKVRVVYDCAAKYKQTSLNQQLLQGPDEANRLIGVLSRFRKETVGIVADIEAMFHQVLVDPRDCDVLRFLWWPKGDLSNDLAEFRMVKHVFGAKSSPSIANFCLKKTAEIENEGIHPDAVDAVKKNMYVDDLMKSTSTEQKAISLVEQLVELLARGGFRLTKWCSNSRKVLEAIPEGERAKSVANLNVERLPTESALGLKWNVEDDKFVWEVSEERLKEINAKPTTRRGILSVIYSIFDPLGFIAPFTMKAKLLLQILSRKKIGWDDQIEEIERVQWTRWLQDLVKLREAQVNRCFKPETFGEVKFVELHLFSDASRVGYSSVGYLRLVDVNGRIHCAFVMGKARLAPIREISIPRLELSAAVISVKLNVLIQEELDMLIERVYYWTDSTSVLKCIHNESKRFHTFESNRLTIIHDGSSPKEWRYVNSESNPADDGSKGVRLDALMRNNRWITGPQFLWEEESFWPVMIEVPELKDEDPELRKEAQVYTTSTVVNDSPLDKLIQYHSSWCKLKRSVAWLLRFRRYLRGLREMSRYLTVEEIQDAETEIVCHVQKAAFPEAIEILKNENDETSKKSVKKSMRKVGLPIYRLDPKLKDGILIVGGRLGNAPIDASKRHPVILPYKDHVTDLIVQSCHQELGHMGQETVLANLRKKFWIVKGRSAVRRMIGKCQDCKRRKARRGEQFMANLPRDRLTPCKPPFTNVGVDYFGPFEVKQGRSRVKRYGCVFTCLAVRAIHVEIAHTLDTDSMINALRRFISIRGCPERIRSDNGTNFTSADREMREELSKLNGNKIERFCARREIKWEFNPPAASHMGGVWERMIRTIRQVLKALLKEQLVNDEVLLTVMAEAVNIINSRPLSRNSDSHLDEGPLTPNHLLHLRPCSSLPPGTFEKSDLYCKRAWRQAQYLANVFWRRWTKEYLPTLMERQKWTTKRRNLRVGDIVLVADDNYARGNWPLARVMDVNVGKDGLVRSATVKTTSTVATRSKKKNKGEQLSTTTVELTRPITKLCLLEMDQENNEDG